MTDNEKRAHDIAVASIGLYAESKQSNAQFLVDGGPLGSEEKSDIYRIYYDIYERVLESLERDFKN